MTFERYEYEYRKFQGSKNSSTRRDILSYLLFNDFVCVELPLFSFIDGPAARVGPRTQRAGLESQHVDPGATGNSPAPHRTRTRHPGVDPPHPGPRAGAGPTGTE